MYEVKITLFFFKFCSSRLLDLQYAESNQHSSLSSPIHPASVLDPYNTYSSDKNAAADRKADTIGLMHYFAHKCFTFQPIALFQQLMTLEWNEEGEYQNK